MRRKSPTPTPRTTGPGTRGAKDSTPTGSPIGWSFYSTFMRCKWEWYLKHVEEVHSLQTPRELVVGIIYHALHEGVPEGVIKSWGQQYSDLFEEGKKAYEARIQKGPPLPEPLSQETNFGGGTRTKRAFTSRIDRLEAGDKKGEQVIREFKTAGAHHDTDALKWGVSGQVIGQLVLSGAKSVTVDILAKSTGRTSQVTVELTPLKEGVWENLILDLEAEITNRLDMVETHKRSPDALFPRTGMGTQGCVTSGGKLCSYYAKCWEPEKASALLYKTVPTLQGWRKYLGLKRKP